MYYLSIGRVDLRSFSSGSILSSGRHALHTSSIARFARFAMNRTGVFGSGRFAPARDLPMNTISFARFEKREVSFQIAQLKSWPKPFLSRSAPLIPAKTPDQLRANRAIEIMAEARSPSIHPTRPCQHTRSIHSKSPHRSHYPLDRLHFSLPTRSHLLWMRGRSASARFHRPDRTRSNAISFARFAMDRTGAFGGGDSRERTSFP